MTARRAHPLCLVRDSRHARQTWCSRNGMGHHTDRVSDATCVLCLRVAAEHYITRRDESSTQVQDLLDRQAEVWCSGAPGQKNQFADTKSTRGSAPYSDRRAGTRFSATGSSPTPRNAPRRSARLPDAE